MVRAGPTPAIPTTSGRCLLVGYGPIWSLGDPNAWWVLLGPAVITAMFVFVSVPMIDARSIERRPEYARHMARVSGLVPLPPKRLP